MKLAYSLVILLCLFLYSSEDVQANNDSLWNVWNNKTLADTLRLEAISQIGNSFVETDPDSAIYYAQIQLDFTTAKDLNKYSAEALKILGTAYELKGDISNAITYYKQSYNLFNQLDDRNNCSDVKYKLGGAFWTAGQYNRALEHYSKSLSLAGEIGDKKNEAKIYRGIAYCYYQQGQYARASQLVLQSLKISEELNDDEGVAWCLNAIGVFYTHEKNLEKALEYYIEGLEINERIDDKRSLAFSLMNIGETYGLLGQRSKELEYYNRSLLIAKEANEKRSIAFAYKHLGNYYSSSSELEKAMKNYALSLSFTKEIGNKDMECELLLTIGELEISRGNYIAGIEESQKGYKIALNTGSITDQLHACNSLYKANKEIGNTALALSFHEKMLALEDSINIESLSTQLQQMEFQKEMVADSLKAAAEKLEISLKLQKEISQKENARNMYLASGSILLLLTLGLFGRNRYMRNANIRIEKEKDRSEELLLNILPSEIADELKSTGEAKARDFDMATVLFTDFKEFTQTSEKLSAQELVEEINTCFKAFDRICEKYNIEKIKTIGDSYMAAGGLPVPTEDSVRNTVLAAIEMQDFMVHGARRTVQGSEGGGRKADSGNLNTEQETRNKEHRTPKADSRLFEMRVGIHTGPVVAGIVGVKKFQYDIWGDTVNTASRAESESEVGKVNITAATYNLIKDDPQFSFESRGMISAKGKGEMEMYFASRTGNGKR